MTSTDPLPDILRDRPDDPVGEALLLQAVRDGSTAAFGILYARYRQLAVGVAVRSLSQANVSMAEDVAEVAFIRVLTALRNGKGPSDTLRAYLTTTVRREAWRAQRRRRRQAEVVDRWVSDEERAVEPDPDPAPLGEAENLGAHALLGEAFRGLSDRWRHVLWLTEVEGRKPAEVAPMLGVSAGSASALAYRARLGLITAYLAAYRRTASDEACVAISERLGAYVSAGAPAEGYADVVAHLEGCSSCRDVSRGVDVIGTVLASMAPFGLLTAGWWAQAAGVGAAGLAGAAAAGAVGAIGAAGGSATGATATTVAGGSGGIGIAGGVAAAAAVVVLASAAWFGIVRSDADSSAAPPSDPAPAATTARVRGAASTAPLATVVPRVPAIGPGPVSSTAPSTDPERATTTRPAPPTTTAAPAATSTTTAPATPTSTTRPAPSTTTTTTAPPLPTGQLTGRAVRPDEAVPFGTAPVSGVQVVAYDDEGQLAASGLTNRDGRWALEQLPPGHYVVVAIVSSAYRPETGEDPWAGGDTWATILGSVDVGQGAIDLVDLRLLTR